MEDLHRSDTLSRAGIASALGAIVGVILSGPLALVTVEAVHPQPAWRGAAELARNYHPVQLLPYLGGIMLVTALIGLIGSVHAAAAEAERPRTTMALIFTSAFAALIFFNYVTQTTFIPELARHYRDVDAPLLETFSMVNPSSLAWGIEMWGWALFGAATWLVAPVFTGSTVARATSWAFVANGPLSIVGALWTVARPGWVMTPVGLVAFTAWNLLLAAMLVLALLSFKKLGRAASTPVLRAKSPGRDLQTP